MAAPTAMCNIETLNGREYKVKDMAMADFGCVLRPGKSPDIGGITLLCAAWNARSHPPVP